MRITLPVGDERHTPEDLRRRREAAGLSQRGLGTLAGYAGDTARVMVSLYERGRSGNGPGVPNRLWTALLEYERQIGGER